MNIPCRQRKKASVFWGLIAAAISAGGSGAPARAEEIVTLSGQVYSNVVVQSYDRNGFNIRHDGGTAVLPYRDIDPELRGHYKAISLIPLSLSKLRGEAEPPAGPDDLVTRAGEIYRNVEIKEIGPDYLRFAHDGGLAKVSFSSLSPEMLGKFRERGVQNPLPPPGNKDLVTAYGQVFRNAEVIQSEPDGLTFRHKGGVTKIAFPALGEELQRQYNYDPIAARAYAREAAARRLAAQEAPLTGSESGGPPTVGIYSIETQALEDNSFWIRFSLQNLTDKPQTVRVVPCEKKLAEIITGKAFDLGPKGDLKLQQIVVPGIRPVFLSVMAGSYRTNALLNWEAGPAAADSPAP